MCEVLDRVENKGRQEGRQEGLQEGRQETITKLIENAGYTFEEVLNLLEIPAEERKLYHP